MSLITLSSLARLTRDDLASLLLQSSFTDSSGITTRTTTSNDQVRSSNHPKIAIIDVRDSDHVGGHIKSSIWVPSHNLEARIPELLRTLRDKDKVVFHCALSQQRGPAAALTYARALEEMRRRDGQGSTYHGIKDEEISQPPKQEVCVLDGGFSLWQAKYGEDERLTEDYVKDIWDS